MSGRRALHALIALPLIVAFLFSQPSIAYAATRRTLNTANSAMSTVIIAGMIIFACGTTVLILIRRRDLKR